MSLNQEGGVVKATDAQIREQIEALDANRENFEGWKVKPAEKSGVETHPTRVDVYHASFVKRPY